MNAQWDESITPKTIFTFVHLHFHIDFRGVIREIFRQAKPMGWHNLPLLVEIGLMYLKI
jgi:hypothetical protein